MTWSTYFPFTSGTPLVLEAAMLLARAEGSGLVETASTDLIDFSFSFPEQRMLGFKIPETRGRLKIKHRQEGKGNFLELTINEDTIIDENVTILSRSDKRRRYIDPSIDLDGRDVSFRLRRRNARIAEISDIDGLPIDFNVRITISEA